MNVSKPTTSKGAIEMNEVVKFLTDNPTFYLATMDGDQARVRPFGAICEYQGKVYLCTGKQKEVYKQLKKNGKFELCTNSPDDEWVRVTGELVEDDRREPKAAMLEAVPMLNDIYSLDDGIYTVFYMVNATAKFESFAGRNETIKI